MPDEALARRLCPGPGCGKDITGRRNHSDEPLQFCSKACFRKKTVAARGAGALVAGYKRAGQAGRPQLDAKVAAIDALERGE